MKDKVPLTEESLAAAAAVNNIADFCKRNSIQVTCKPVKVHIDLNKVIQLVHERDRLKRIAHWEKKYEWR